MLHFDLVSILFGPTSFNILVKTLIYTIIITDADALFRFGGGSGPIHHSEFQCNGSESHLLNCSISVDSSTERVQCLHSEDAGVRCRSGETISPYLNCIFFVNEVVNTQG